MDCWKWLVNPLNTHPLGQLVWSSVYPLQETIDQSGVIFYRDFGSAGLVTGDSSFVAGSFISGTISLENIVLIRCRAIHWRISHWRIHIGGP